MSILKLYTSLCQKAKCTLFAWSTVAEEGMLIAALRKRLDFKTELLAAFWVRVFYFARSTQKSCIVALVSISIMRSNSNCFLLLLLISWFAVTITTAQTRLNVFRGTLVHSRVRTEMEVLPDHLIGVDVNDLGRVKLHVVGNTQLKNVFNTGNSILACVIYS